MPSPKPSNIGNTGQLVHRSPDSRFEIRLATMATFPAEAIVNATDYFMAINTANLPCASSEIIHAAGPDLKNYLRHKYSFSLRTGNALATPSFVMPNCSYVIHVNGPNYRTRSRRIIPLLKQQLADCYRRCMEEAFKLGVKSVAFPPIGTGASLGWPRNEASSIGVQTVRAWLRHPIHGLKRREVVEKVFILADPVGRQAHQEGAWCAAFREIWPQALPPSRGRLRVAFTARHSTREEPGRCETSVEQIIRSQQILPVTSELDNHPKDNSLAKSLRRSSRKRRRPQRYRD